MHATVHASHPWRLAAVPPHPAWSTALSCNRASSQPKIDVAMQFLQVLGDRELLEDDVTVGELAVASAKNHAAASNLHLHIVCKLKDIESVSIATSMDRTLTFRNEDMPSPPIRRSKSALTALLADNSDK